MNKPTAKQAAKNDRRPDKKKKEKKKGRAGRLVLILLVVLLLLISGACGYLLFGAGNAEYTISVIKSGKTFKDVTDAELVAQKNQFEEDKKAFDKKKEDLDKKEKTLSALEEKLKKQQEALDSQTSAAPAGADMSEEETQRLIKIYETMDSSKAADIFNKMNDVGKVTKLLIGMKQTSASKILQAMDSSLAATITKNIMARDAVVTPYATISPSPASTSTPLATFKTGI